MRKDNKKNFNPSKIVPNYFDSTNLTVTNLYN